MTQKQLACIPVDYNSERGGKISTILRGFYFTEPDIYPVEMGDRVIALCVEELWGLAGTVVAKRAVNSATIDSIPDLANHFLVTIELDD